MYHISPAKLENLKLHPRVPVNYMTTNGYEDNVTPRVCFGDTMTTALTSLFHKRKGDILYVYRPKNRFGDSLYCPTVDKVPDSKITQEVWSVDSIEVELFCKIEVLDPIEPGIKYTYGEDLEAELYAFEYKIIKYY